VADTDTKVVNLYKICSDKRTEAILNDFSTCIKQATADMAAIAKYTLPRMRLATESDPNVGVAMGASDQMKYVIEPATPTLITKDVNKHAEVVRLPSLVLAAELHSNEYMRLLRTIFDTKTVIQLIAIDVTKLLFGN
jgi:hypothetical protein